MRIYQHLLTNNIMKKINVAELLKDCPNGTELYSPLCGRCVFDRLNMGTIICKKQNTQEITFTSEGYYMIPVFDNCECVLFPSKDQRDWSKFQRPFKDGDIVVTKTSHNFIFYSIYQGVENREVLTYVDYYLGSNKLIFNTTFHSLCFTDEIVEQRLATEEEKEKLFDAIKANGYKWNPETKTPEALIEPKFKVGDKIRHKAHIIKGNTVTEIKDTHYILDDELALPFINQDNYELVPNKFDITTLKPFDKVLVRDNNKQKWTVDLFSFYDKDLVYTYACVGHYVNQCIPYEGNEHLLGKTDDCDEYYKTWE